MNALPSPYPWDRLEQLSRTSVEAERRLEAELSFDAQCQRLCAELTQWSGEQAHFEPLRYGAWRSSLGAPEPRLLFRGTRRPFGLLACLDPRLCLRLVERLLGGSELIPVANAPIDDATLGAVAALSSHLIEQAGGFDLVRVGPGSLTSEPWITVEGILHWGEGQYETVLAIDWPLAPSGQRQRVASLQRLGSVEFTLRLQLTSFEIAASELSRLAPGAVLLAADGCWIDPAGNAEGYLVGDQSPWAYPVTLLGGRQIVLGPRAVNREIEPVETRREASDPLGVGRLVAELPLVVQAEIASLTLTAERLACLRPGDILETPRGIAEPVLLRVQGRAIANAELVNVDGQVGLRVLELLTGEFK